MVGGSDYDFKRAGRAGWVMAGLFCAAVIVAFIGLAMWSSAKPAQPTVTYADQCPPEYPMMVEIHYKTVCIAGARPLRVLKEQDR